MQEKAMILPMKKKYAPDVRKHQGIPGIEITPEGVIFICYYANTEPCEGPGSFVIVSRSDDFGKSWREMTVFAPARPELRLYDATLWLAPDDILRIYWAQCRSEKAGDIFDGRAGVWLSECRDYRAENLKWSRPRRIGDGVMLNKPTVLQNGSWALPAALHSVYPEKMLPELQGCNRSNILLTKDCGKTYQLILGPDIPKREFDEHVIIERRDGSLWVLVRTRCGIGQSFSSDGGNTWSPGEDSGLGGPCSRFAMRRLKSGRLCLINHISEHRLPGAAQNFSRRENLAAWLSDDDGKSWYGRLILNSELNVSYPDFTEGNDGFIYAVYDQNRTGNGQVFLARFTEQDIAAGKWIVPGSTSRILAASFPDRPQ